jgi:ABC-type glycerol-3-phosphate transport system substrate-binding protein
MKRFITWILLFILCGLLLGCRSDGAVRPDSPAAATATISVAGYPSFQPAYERLIQQFQEEYPDFQVQFVPLSGQQANLSLRQQATLADVVLLEGQPPTTDAAAAFLNLAPLMAADPTFDAADFWPGIMDACRAAGVQIGLPFRANASLIFFDKAAFDAAGLPHPEPGWTWEDFRQAAQALALSDGEQTTRYGFVDSGNPMGLLAPLVDNIIRQSGDTLDGRRIAAELAWYVTLANDNVILSESGSLPHERQAAMWVSSQFGLTAARAVLGDDLGVAAFPATGVSQSNPVTAGCALISAGTSHSQAAWTFVHYLSQQALFATGVYPATPARPSVAQSSGYWEGMEATTAVTIRAALEEGWYRRAEMPELATVGDALNQALTGEMALVESLPGPVDIQPTIPPPPPDDAPIAVATPRVTLTPGADVIVVDYFVNRNIHGSDEAIDALATAFNQSQNRIEVRTLRTGYGMNPPDQAENFDCFVTNGRAEPWANYIGYDEFRNMFYSLTPLLVGEDAALRDDYETAHLEPNEVAGELYALPFSFDPWVIRYNATLFDELGLERPSPDWTIDDFWALAEAATYNDAGRQVYGFFPGPLHPENLLMLVPGADYLFDPDSEPPGASNFTGPGVVQALAWLGDKAESGVLYPFDWGGSRVNFLEDSSWWDQGHVIDSGHVALWVEWLGQGSQPYRPFMVGTAPYPQSHLNPLGGQTASPTMLLISRRAAQPTGCWEWFKFLTAQPSAYDGVPARISVMESAGWQATVSQEVATAFRRMVSWPSYLRVNIPHWFSMPYRFWWADALHDVFAGDIPTAVLTDIQLKAELFYACYETLIEPESEQIKACVLQADPDFRR